METNEMTDFDPSTNAFNADQFAEKLGTFVVGCYAISNAYRRRHYPNCPEVTITTTIGPRYVKLVRGYADGSQRSVHCFVDKTTGDVLKAAGWAKPAKHARGNIFDDKNGLGLMNEYGPAYLR